MKKYIISISVSLTMFSLAMILFVPIQNVQAQTSASVVCPTGYTCKPIKAQPVNCPMGYICEPVGFPDKPVSTPISTPVKTIVPVPSMQPCPIFSMDIGMNSSGQDVAELQTQLIIKGFDIPAISSGRASKGYFGSQTAEALKKFQQSENEIATGILNLSTLQKINSITGCVLPPNPNPTSIPIPSVDPINNPPKIFGFPAIQTSIQPGQSVNFSLSAKDSDNDDLSWSVDWGENVAGTGSCSVVRRKIGTGWSFSESHSWAKAGMYKVKVTVSDCVGGSDSYIFTVNVGTVATPLVTVLSPNGGESWQKGTTQTIKWKDNTPEPYCPTGAGCSYQQIIYDIFLDGSQSHSGDVYPTGYVMQKIATGILGSSYSWRIADSTGGIGNYYALGNYRIRICQSGTDVCDSSDSYFKIF